MRWPLIFVLALSGCSGLTSNKPSSESKSKASSEASADQQNRQDSQHASDSKQGTISQPIIVICNVNNSAGSNCATPVKDGPVDKVIHDTSKKGTK